MGQEGETWKTWSEAKGTAAEKGRHDKFARGTDTQTLTTRRCAEVSLCPRPRSRKMDTGGRLDGLLYALERGEPRNIP